MKYIIAKISGEERVVLFSDSFTHSIMAARLGFKKESLVSAGFVSMEPDGAISAFGKSLSLHIRSRECDGEIIMKEMRS